MGRDLPMKRELIVSSGIPHSPELPFRGVGGGATAGDWRGDSAHQLIGKFSLSISGGATEAWWAAAAEAPRYCKSTGQQQLPVGHLQQRDRDAAGCGRTYKSTTDKTESPPTGGNEAAATMLPGSHGDGVGAWEGAWWWEQLNGGREHRMLALTISLKYCIALVVSEWWKR